MRKFLLFALLAVYLMAAAGCVAVSGADQDTPPEITGLIFDVDGSRILVVKGIENIDMPYDEWFEAGHRAAWFTVTGDTVIKSGGAAVSAENLEKGQKVQVWAVGPMAESYPEQGEAKIIIIVED
jgi:hypothetical protein